jgi:hypothetical protein
MRAPLAAVEGGVNWQEQKEEDGGACKRLRVRVGVRDA